MSAILPGLIASVLGSGVVPSVVDAAAPLLKTVLPDALVNTGADIIKGVANTFAPPAAQPAKAETPSRGQYEPRPTPEMIEGLETAGSRMESPSHVSTNLTTPAGRVIAPSMMNAANNRSIIVPSVAQTRYSKTLNKPRREDGTKKERTLGDLGRRRVRRYF